MSIPSSVAKILEVIAVWRDPERREKVILREAIEAAEELFKILRKQERYASMNDKELARWELHFTKRWNAWKDGQA